MYVSKSPLPADDTGGTGFLSKDCDRARKMLSPRKLLRDPVPRVFTGSRARRQPLPGAPEIPASRREAGLQHKPCCLYKPFRDTHSLFPVGAVGILPKPKLLGSRQGPASQAGSRVKLLACCGGRSGRGALKRNFLAAFTATGSAMQGNCPAGEPGVHGSRRTAQQNHGRQ